MKFVYISILVDTETLTGDEIIIFKLHNNVVAQFNIRQRINSYLFDEKMSGMTIMKKYGKYIDICPDWLTENTIDFVDAVDISYQNITDKFSIASIKTYYTTKDCSPVEYLMNKKNQ